MPHFFRLSIVGMVLILGVPIACRWSPSEEIEVRVQAGGPSSEGDRGNPKDPLDLECFVVSVTGEDVSAAYTEKIGSVDPACLGIGALSNFVTKDELLKDGISLKIRAGSKRYIRLWGVQGLGTSSCSKMDLVSVLGVSAAELYELGSTTMDLFKDSEVVIENTYTTSSKELISQCASGSGGGGGNSAAITGVAELHRIYLGSSLTGGGSPLFDNGELDTFLPPKHWAPGLTNIPAESLPITADTVGPNAQILKFHPSMFSAFSPGHVRVDFVWDTSGFFPDNLKVTILVEAGTTSFDGNNCGNTINRATAAFASIYKGSTSEWETASSGSPNIINGIFSEAPFSESGDGLPIESYFHGSIRSGDPSATSLCSAIRLISIHTEKVAGSRK